MMTTSKGGKRGKRAGGGSVAHLEHVVAFVAEERSRWQRGAEHEPRRRRLTTSLWLCPPQLHAVVQHVLVAFVVEGRNGWQLGSEDAPPQRRRRGRRRLRKPRGGGGGKTKWSSLKEGKGGGWGGGALALLAGRRPLALPASASGGAREARAREMMGPKAGTPACEILEKGGEMEALAHSPATPRRRAGAAHGGSAAGHSAANVARDPGGAGPSPSARRASAKGRASRA